MTRDQEPKDILGFTMSMNETGSVCYIPDRLAPLATGGVVVISDVAPVASCESGDPLMDFVDMVAEEDPGFYGTALDVLYKKGDDEGTQ
jgi:hypothetical protein